MTPEEQARARFMLAAATIERDVRLSDLTDEEIDRLTKALSREEQVRAEERERCARVAANMAAVVNSAAALKIAAAVRASGHEGGGE